MSVPGIEPRFFIFYHYENVPPVTFNWPLMTNLTEYLISREVRVETESRSNYPDFVHVKQTTN